MQNDKNYADDNNYDSSDDNNDDNNNGYGNMVTYVYRTGRYIHKDPYPESYCHCWSIPHRQIPCIRSA